MFTQKLLVHFKINKKKKTVMYCFILNSLTVKYILLDYTVFLHLLKQPCHFRLLLDVFQLFRDPCFTGRLQMQSVPGELPSKFTMSEKPCIWSL